MKQVNIRHTHARENITRMSCTFFLALQNDNHVNIRVHAFEVFTTY